MSKLNDQAKSVGTKLSNLARNLKVAYPKVLTEFLLERLTARLVADPALASRLIFKGGYVSLRIYDSPRFTIDLDALLTQGSLGELSVAATKAAQIDLGDAVWFRLERTVDLQTQGDYGGLRLVFRSGIGEILPDLRRAQIINLDIGTGDPVIPGPVSAETPFLLGGGSLSWRVYPAETTVSEKLHALISRGGDSSRSKDLFDLNLLLPRCDPTMLKRSLVETFRYRGTELPKDIPAFLKGLDLTLLSKGWVTAVADISGKFDFKTEFGAMIEKVWKLIG